MGIDLPALRQTLCDTWCRSVELRSRDDGWYQIDLPLRYADGDGYQLYVRARDDGTMELSDLGATFMHLSYYMDIERIGEGTRQDLLRQVLGQAGMEEDDGRLYRACPPGDLGRAVFEAAQVITRISDLEFLNRERVRSAFMADLDKELRRVASDERVHSDYREPRLRRSDDYPIDFKLDGKHRPLFVFGVNNKDKARLSTIVLQQLLVENVDFDSLLVFEDQGRIPRADLARLSNAGGEQVASLEDVDVLRRKVSKKLAA